MSNVTVNGMDVKKQSFITEMIDIQQKSKVDISKFIIPIKLMDNVKVPAHASSYNIYDKEKSDEVVGVFNIIAYLEDDSVEIFKMTDLYQDLTLTNPEISDVFYMELINKDKTIKEKDKTYIIYIKDISVEKIHALYQLIVTDTRLFVDKAVLNLIMSNVIDYGIYLNKI